MSVTVAGPPRPTEPSPPGGLSAVWPYVQIARVDHWFKNAFMVLGVVLAVFYEPGLASWQSLWPLARRARRDLPRRLEQLRAERAARRPERPDAPGEAPSAGAVRPRQAWHRLRRVARARGRRALDRAGRSALGFFLSALWLWVMGMLYNVPPLRTKEWPYVDVLSESVNNPIRLLLGWFALIADRVPPLSLALSYWMIGAFFMAMKRYAEYRHIGDPAVAAAYRRSFRYYNEERLLVTILFYATTCALFAGIFIVRYHLELILFAPFAAGLFAFYLHLGMKPDSPVQNPEKLYRERGFVAYLVVCFVVFVVLMFTSIPAALHAVQRGAGGDDAALDGGTVIA